MQRSQKIISKIAAIISAGMVVLVLPFAVYADTQMKVQSNNNDLAVPQKQKSTPSAGSAFSAALDATAGRAGVKSSRTFPQIVGGYIKAAVGLLGIILVVLIIYAGFLWMTAAGNEDKVKKAKGILSNAVVGLVLVFAAYAITDWVISAIIGGDSSSSGGGSTYGGSSGGTAIDPSAPDPMLTPPH